MGRPRGSKNKKSKNKFTKKLTARRGRPVGSKNHLRTKADYGKNSRKSLACKCGTIVSVGSEAESVLCAKCVQKSLPMPTWGNHKVVDKSAPKRPRGRPRTRPVVIRDPNAPKGKRGRPRTRPILPPKPTSGFGRGWHLKAKFKAPNGKFYSFGKEIK